MAEMFGREAVYEMLKESRRIAGMAEKLDWEIADVIAKATEELGEFSTAVQIKNGKIRNKTNDHEYAPFDEGADVLICVLDAISRSYPDMPASQVYCLFLHWMNKKCQKWVNKVEKEYQEVILNDEDVG